ncbi:MAG: SPASM domain-containing protein [Phycisphaeraceae bacterium]|nr:SPASM domain-containing protein [Phycisphaeraceae bacterium]
MKRHHACSTQGKLPITDLIESTMKKISSLAYRLTNRIMLWLCMKLQTTRVYNKPMHALFEMSSSCNLDCPLCNTGGLKHEFKHIKRGNMSFTTFQKGMNTLLPQLEHILLYNWGGPFLNKDLVRCITYATSQNVTTQLSTNMNLYTQDLGRGMIESGLTKMVVSCDGLTQKTYEQYRTGGELAKVASAVLDLISQKKQTHSKFPLIEMQFIVFSHNEHEIEAFETYWKNKGVDTVNFIRMSYMSEVGEKVAKANRMVPQHQDFQPDHPYGSIKKCSFPYGQITLNYNGDWYTCCFPAGETDYRIDNILTADFWTVWNGPYYQYSRKLLRTQQIPKGEFQTMCHDCTGIFPQRDGIRNYWSMSLPVLPMADASQARNAGNTEHSS